MTLKLEGQKFNMLTVLEKGEPIFENYGRKRLTWLCICDCGNITTVTANALRNGLQSCGCMKGGHYNHGLTYTRIYTIYTCMKGRCYNKNNKAYHYYGGRGITICPEWLYHPEVFADWAKNNGYSDDLSIDRIDNNLGYSPDNCRWSTCEQQNRNRRFCQ